MSGVALCFPGQGSQSPGMATGLLDAPGAAELLEAAAAEGLDLTAALGGGDDILRPTDVAQPALLFTGAVLGRAVRDAGLAVAAVAGHSVGEYAALVAADVLTPGDAMRLVVARGRAMAAMRDGGMTALLGADAEVAEEVCAAVRAQGGTVVVANLNAPGQVVLSGDREALQRAAAMARERGARRAMPLNVGGAFHSPLMAAAAAEFAVLVDAASLRTPRVPVVCNVDGAAVRDAAGIRDRLRRQLAAPVRWSDCVSTLVALAPDALVELGPGGVLSGLSRRIAPSVVAVAAGTTAEVAGLGARLQSAAHG